MYAIIQSRGQQVKVTPGGFVLVAGTLAEPGAQLTLEEVLLVEKDGGEVLAGAPFVANAKVIAVVEGETRGPKIRVTARVPHDGGLTVKVASADVRASGRYAQASSVSTRQAIVNKWSKPVTRASVCTYSGVSDRVFPLSRPNPRSIRYCWR